MSTNGIKRQWPIKTIDKKAVERILSETRIGNLTNTDTVKLCQALNAALAFQKWYDNFPLTKTIVRKRVKRIIEIENCARQLRHSLLMPSGDPIFDLMLAQKLGRYTGSDFNSFKIDPKAEPFTSTILRLDWLIETLGKISLNPNPGPSRATQKLITVALATCYEKHLGRPAGKSHPWDDGRKIGGPFIRFVQAVMGEAGIPVATKNSIATYIKRHRKEGRQNLGVVV